MDHTFGKASHTRRISPVAPPLFLCYSFPTMTKDASFRFTHAITRRPAASIIQGLRAVDTGTPDLATMQAHHAAYIATLKAGEGLSETTIREGYSRFKAEKNAAELVAIAARHGIVPHDLQVFVDAILQRMIFDGDALTDLMEPLGLNWKARRVTELDLMADLMPLLHKRADGREISGLSAYDQ